MTSMVIVHGEDQVASRKLFIKLKEDQVKLGNSVMELENDTDMGTLVSATESQSLFGQANAVFMQGVFSSRPSNAKKELIAYLQSKQSAEIYIWEGKDVSVQLKEFGPQAIKRFDLPKHIFAFMTKPTVELLHKCLESMPVEQIFASLVTRLYKQHDSEGLLKLLEIDYKNKTAQLPYDLATGLELYIMENNAQTVRN